MKEVVTNISWGFLELLKTFFEANKLDVACIERVETAPPRSMVTLSYEENSDTAMSITLMSYRHLGLENMLCDYLIKCGISPSMIAIGQAVATRRDMRKLDEDWEKYRREELGFK